MAVYQHVIHLVHCEIINVCYKCVIKMSKCVIKIEKRKTLMTLMTLTLMTGFRDSEMIMTLNDFDPS